MFTPEVPQPRMFDRFLDREDGLVHWVLSPLTGPGCGNHGLGVPPNWADPRIVWQPVTAEVTCPVCQAVVRGCEGPLAVSLARQGDLVAQVVAAIQAKRKRQEAGGCPHEWYVSDLRGPAPGTPTHQIVQVCGRCGAEQVIEEAR